MPSRQVELASCPKGVWIVLWPALELNCPYGTVSYRGEGLKAKVGSFCSTSSHLFQVLRAPACCSLSSNKCVYTAQHNMVEGLGEGWEELCSRKSLGVQGWAQGSSETTGSGIWLRVPKGFGLMTCTEQRPLCWLLADRTLPRTVITAIPRLLRRQTGLLRVKWRPQVCWLPAPVSGVSEDHGEQAVPIFPRLPLCTGLASRLIHTVKPGEGQLACMV